MSRRLFITLRMMIYGKPHIHAVSSAKHYGGSPDDYLDIHQFMDSSKGAIADNRHRALTHNSWFLSVVLSEGEVIPISIAAKVAKCALDQTNHVVVSKSMKSTMRLVGVDSSKVDSILRSLLNQRALREVDMAKSDE